jgi:hypothetical protein
MADATGETNKPLRVAFDRRLKLEFHGTRITSDGGLTGANDGGRSRGENHAPKVGGARQETSGRAPKRLSTAHAARGRPSGEPSG